MGPLVQAPVRSRSARSVHAAPAGRRIGSRTARARRWMTGSVPPGSRSSSLWMMDRAVVQPDPAIFLGMAADTMQAAEDATSLEDLFLRLEDAGIMLRIDRTVTP